MQNKLELHFYWSSLDNKLKDGVHVPCRSQCKTKSRRRGFSSGSQVSLTSVHKGKSSLDEQASDFETSDYEQSSLGIKLHIIWV